MECIIRDAFTMSIREGVLEHSFNTSSLKDGDNADIINGSQVSQRDTNKNAVAIPFPTVSSRSSTNKDSIIMESLHVQGDNIVVDGLYNSLRQDDQSPFTVEDVFKTSSIRNLDDTDIAVRGGIIVSSTSGLPDTNTAIQDTLNISDRDIDNSAVIISNNFACVRSSINKDATILDGMVIEKDLVNITNIFDSIRQDPQLPFATGNTINISAIRDVQDSYSVMDGLNISSIRNTSGDDIAIRNNFIISSRDIDEKAELLTSFSLSSRDIDQASKTLDGFTISGDYDTLTNNKDSILYTLETLGVMDTIHASIRDINKSGAIRDNFTISSRDVNEIIEILNTWNISNRDVDHLSDILTNLNISGGFDTLSNNKDSILYTLETLGVMDSLNSSIRNIDESAAIKNSFTISNVDINSSAAILNTFSISSRDSDFKACILTNIFTDNKANIIDGFTLSQFHDGEDSNVFAIRPSWLAEDVVKPSLPAAILYQHDAESKKVLNVFVVWC